MNTAHGVRSERYRVRSGWEQSKAQGYELMVHCGSPLVRGESILAPVADLVVEVLQIDVRISWTMPRLTVRDVRDR